MINHNFKKKYGQNFISDKNLLTAICNDAGLKEDDQVLEIGAGGGNLTCEIAKRSFKVVSYEIDNDLKEHLHSLKLSNVDFVFADIMNQSLEEIESHFEGDYKLIANLPYYITSPIILKFLKSKRLQSLTVMVQKEVALRMRAKPGDKDYGVLSVITAFYGGAEITREVSRKMFFPEPSVDSAIIHININRKNAENIDGEKFFKFLTHIFAKRRKTLNNNLKSAGFSGEKIALLGEENLKKRAEEFSIDTLIDFYEKIFS